MQASRTTKRCPAGWVIHALIGDVCGRGPAEAALGVCLRVAWRALVLAGQPRRRALRRPARAQARTAGRGHVRHRVHGVGGARPVAPGCCGWPATRRRCCSRRTGSPSSPRPRHRRPGSTTGRAGPPARSSSATAGRCCCTPTG